jgi:NAD(P)-dependent dehydrogenase (short-subunit alcohol dehydrogenase family)
MFANHFKNKVAVVSGCGGGMGLAVAQMLADSA